MSRIPLDIVRIEAALKYDAFASAEDVSEGVDVLVVLELELPEEEAVGASLDGTGGVPHEIFFVVGFVSREVGEQMSFFTLKFNEPETISYQAIF